MRIQKFLNVKIIEVNSKFTVSIFKKGKRKIAKNEYDNYLYTRALNFGLFYIGFGGINRIDISSDLGLIRFKKWKEAYQWKE